MPVLYASVMHPGNIPEHLVFEFGFLQPRQRGIDQMRVNGSRVVTPALAPPPGKRAGAGARIARQPRFAVERKMA